jgi:hypothetical protein
MEQGDYGLSSYLADLSLTLAEPFVVGPHHTAVGSLLGMSKCGLRRLRIKPKIVMAGLDPAISVPRARVRATWSVVDARIKSGHDDLLVA